jgi:hypothetical protein
MSFVTCDLQGRIGNELFICAATLGYSEKYRVPAYFPPNQYGLPLLPIGYEVKNVWNEREDHLFQEIPYMENLKLSGYFQKVDYFKNIKSIIRDTFQKWLYDCVDVITSPNTCSIHVRLTDYQKYKDYFFQLNRENYYDKAINQFEKGTEFIIYSDDIIQAKEMFPEPEFYILDEPDPKLSLIAMSLCESNIIANSTFSFWAAFLNPNPFKKIISPCKEHWFCGLNEHLHTEGLIPEYWIKI